MLFALQFNGMKQMNSVRNVRELYEIAIVTSNNGKYNCKNNIERNAIKLTNFFQIESFEWMEREEEKSVLNILRYSLTAIFN